MLTIEQQKRLTEFLGECWHEFGKAYLPDGPTICVRCGTLFIQCQRLDFSDWRVAGRLVSTITDAGQRGITLTLSTFGQWECYIISGDAFGDIRDYQEADTPQEAVCKAIDSYLKEREG